MQALCVNNNNIVVYFLRCLAMNVTLVTVPQGNIVRNANYCHL